MSATLTARCPSCPHSAVVSAEAIFEFDARCPGCGEVLILEDDEDAEEFEGGESSIEFEFQGDQVSEDAEEGFHSSLDSSPGFDPFESREEGAFGGHVSPFQGIGMNDRAGMDILALAASALDPDVDLSEHQFGGVREVPEVRLSESGEGGILAPTDSDRMRRLREERTGSGRLRPKSSSRLQRQPKSSSRLQRQPKSSSRLQRQPKSSSRLQRQTQAQNPRASQSGTQTRVGTSGPYPVQNESARLRREVEELKQSIQEDSLKKSSAEAAKSAEEALLAAAERCGTEQGLSFDGLPPEAPGAAALESQAPELEAAPAPEPGRELEPLRAARPVSTAAAPPQPVHDGLTERLVSPAVSEAPVEPAPHESQEIFRPTESVALLRGEVAPAPPLPSWEGGDTQQVGVLAKSDPSVEALLPPLVEFSEPLLASAERSPLGLESDSSPALPGAVQAPRAEAEGFQGEEDLDELADLVELPERGSSGRMSRVYDAAQVVGADGQVTLPPDSRAHPRGAAALNPSLAATIPPSDEGAALVESTLGGLAADAPLDAETEERISRLFQDADWLALLDDTMTETEGLEDEGEGRRVIRLSQTAAEAVEDPERMREAQSTLERDGAAALEALLLGSTSSSDSRAAQRFPKDVVQPPTTQFSRGEVGSTKVFTPESAEGAQEGEGAEPTSTFQLDEQPAESTDTRSWVNSRPAPSSGERRLAPGSSERSSSRLRALSATEIRPRMIVERFHRDQLDPGLVCVSDLEARESDLFRQLYEQVFHGVEAHSPEGRERGRVILVTSARPGEGKTVVASNLAVVGARVPGEGAVLVNADPRGRGILPAFGQRTPAEGLLEALSTDRDPTRFVVRLRLKELDVIPLGLRGSNAAELIASESMRTFIENLRRVYPRQSILIDGSSVLGAADPLALARMVDKVLLVVRARKTSKADVEQAVRLIGRQRLAGIVLNDAAEAA